MNAVKRNCGLLYMPSHAPKYIRISNAHEVKAETVRELKNYLYIFTGLFMPFPLTHTHTHTRMLPADFQPVHIYRTVIFIA